MSAQLYRRLAGIALLLLCALRFTPNTGSVELIDTVLVPLAAAAGVWLIFDNLVLLALCVLALALAHSRFGSADPLRGIIYPGIAVLAGIGLVLAAQRRARKDSP